MAFNNRPQGRKKNVSEEEGSGVHRRGEGLGGGPVGNPENYADRPAIERPAENADETKDGNASSSLRRKAGGSVPLGGGIRRQGSSPASDDDPLKKGLRKYRPFRGMGVMAFFLTLALSLGLVTSAFASDPFSMLFDLFGGYEEYDYGSAATYSTASGSYSGWSSGSSNTGILNTQVAAGSRNKFTRLAGNGRDTVNIMVYMCGTDLESRSRMATSDLVEMASADIYSGGPVNIVVYTGGCSKWQISGMSNRTNQIYQVRDGGLDLLVEDDGDRAMTDPNTLARFLAFCSQNFYATRNILIFWDHGGGSVTGYGYDERHSRTGSMDLTEIYAAIESSGMTFDIIGFDACLMATTEVALSLSPFADYLIASEETEPGTGWYYTNWLNTLAANPSIPTTTLGKQIIDDFIDVSASQARGQSTTLSLVDLAELSHTFPDEFTDFARDTTTLIEQNQYKAISDARSGSREFARSSKIDQVDLVSLALHLESTTRSNIGERLASSVLSAVKYNRTSKDMTDSYGLSIYCPKDKLSSVNTMVQTYEALGLDEEYTDCIKKLATIQASGQAVAGGYSSPFGSLSGGSYSQSPYGSSSDSYGSLFGSAGTSLMSDIIGSLLFGRSMPELGLDENAASFMADSGLSEEQILASLEDNLFDARNLYWDFDGSAYTMHLPEEQWELVHDLQMNVFYDDGEGYIDLGMDAVVDYTEDGDLLVEGDRTWIHINGQPVAYYCISSTFGDDDTYSIIGRVPCLLNGVQVNLILIYDDENPDGYIAGARTDYVDGETDTVAKAMTAIEDGDVIEFLCDYYTYDNVFQDRYYLGEPLTVSGPLEISDRYLDRENPQYILTSYRFTDIYGQNYWSAAI